MMERMRENSFVCLDEVTGDCYMDRPNPVIYNPGRDSMAYRAELLFKTIKENVGLELSSAQINSLIRYDVHETKGFIIELRQIIDGYRRTKKKK